MVREVESPVSAGLGPQEFFLICYSCRSLVLPPSEEIDFLDFLTYGWGLVKFPLSTLAW